MTDSRDTDEGAAIRRRRQCLSCGRRFTTYETVEKLPLRVIKKNGKRELFDRSKIRNGITRACEKTNVSSAQIEEIIDLVEHTIRSDPKRELPTTEIGNIVMDALCKLDQVAYVRFASVYREFKDINTFMQELQNLMTNQQPSSKTSQGGGKEMKALIEKCFDDHQKALEKSRALSCHRRYGEDLRKSPALRSQDPHLRQWRQRCRRAAHRCGICRAIS